MLILDSPMTFTEEMGKLQKKNEKKKIANNKKREGKFPSFELMTN